jgi:hypothetical protein
MCATNRPVSGSIAWLDLNTCDVDAACRFYGGLLGWSYTVAQTPVGAYHIALLGDREIAGLMAAPADAPEPVPPMWTIFIEVAAIEETIAAAVTAGGTVLQAPLDVPSGARVAVLADPAGAMLALIESPAEAGTLVRDEPGGLWWAEVLSRDAQAATAFYEAIFGWKSELTTSPDGTSYTRFWLDDQPVAGLMAMPPQVPVEAPSHWMLYFAVLDIERAVAAATELGGAVVRAPMTLPLGRFAVMEDPGGVVFAVCEPDRSARPR